LTGPDGRIIWVYQPPRAEGPLPVVILLDGEIWAGHQSIATTVDNLLADNLIAPAYFFLLDSGGRERRWAELSADGGVDTWIATRLLPWIRQHYPVSDSPRDVIVAGQSLGGYTALVTALHYPEAVGAVLSQSASLWQGDILSQLASAEVINLRAYLEVGTQEWVLHEPNQHFAAKLAAAGANVHYVEYNGGHDYACWRGGIADGLRLLLPPNQTSY
jgi:enterochelin esterase family protein